MIRIASAVSIALLCLSLAVVSSGCEDKTSTPAAPSTAAPADAGAGRATASAAAPSTTGSASPQADHSGLGGDTPHPGHAMGSVAAVSGPPPRGTTVEITGTAGKGSAYLSLPKEPAAGKRPAVIVIQEWWGLEDWIKRNADRFADQGYVTLAVDLYRGKSTKDPGEAHELMRGLPDDRALADLEAGFAYLAARPDVDPAKIGAIGWCMGGGYALKLAAAEPKLAATVVNYGQLVTDKAAIAKIKASLLGNFAGQDRGIPPADVKQFEEAMKASKKDVDIKVYDPNGHAFMNPGNKDGYDEAASQDAWKRIDAFFAKKLKG